MSASPSRPPHFQVVLEKPGKFIIKSAPAPAGPDSGSALVRVRRIGVCGTDLHAFGGRQPFFEYPRVLGHELGVEVLESGSPGFSPGDRCSVEPYLNDPTSPASRRGQTNCCESLKVLGVHIDGGMTPVLNVPLDKLHRSSRLGFDDLALVEMLSVGAHAVERANLQPGEPVLVVGAGPIGLSTALFAARAGARVIAADVSPLRLQRAQALANVSGVVTAGDEKFEEMLGAAFAGERPQVIIDATGNKGSMEGSFDLVAHGGRIVFVGLTNGPITFDNPNFHRREITLMSSRNAPSSTLAGVIEDLESGAISLDGWISHRLALADVPEAFPKIVGDPNLIKAVISAD